MGERPSSTRVHKDPASRFVLGGLLVLVRHEEWTESPAVRNAFLKATRSLVGPDVSLDFEVLGCPFGFLQLTDALLAGPR